MRNSFILTLAVLALTFISPALAQGTYTQIDYPGAAQTYAEGMNNAGDIVGTYGDASGLTLHGFLLHAGVYTTIDYPGATFTLLSGLNDVGQIVGYTGTPVVSFLYDIATQTFTTIGYPGASNTFARAINNNGAIAGVFHDSVRNSDYGFELLGSTYRRIVPPGLPDSSAYGITASGKLIGSVAAKDHPTRFFLFQHGAYQRLTTPGFPDAAYYGINPKGTALVGMYTPDSGAPAGFLYQDQVWQTVQFPAANITSATAVNDAAQVAGTFYDTGGAPHGFLWTPPAAAGTADGE